MISVENQVLQRRHFTAHVFGELRDLVSRQIHSPDQPHVLQILTRCAHTHRCITYQTNRSGAYPDMKHEGENKRGKMVHTRISRHDEEKKKGKRWCIPAYQA